MTSRPPLAIALAALATMALAGCEKPNPGATVWSGTDSEHVEAVCWNHEDAPLGARDCAQDVLQRASNGEGIPSIDVKAGNTLGVSVDPVVAEAGWSVSIGGQPVAQDLDETYYRFEFPSTPTGGPGYTLQIVAGAGASGARGYWFVQLVPR